MAPRDQSPRLSGVGIRHVVLQIASIVVLFGAAACGETDKLTAPGGNSAVTSRDFSGTWVGVSRVVSCDPPGAACASHPTGFERYFAAAFTQQGDAVDGSVIITAPGPLVLPYGFPVKGRVLASGQLSFERLLLDAREPRFSGDLAVKTASGPELVGRMTEQGSSSLAEPVVLVWDVATVRR